MVHIPLPITKGLRWANWAPAGREGAVADPVNGAVPLHSNNWERQEIDTLPASERADRSRDSALRQDNFPGD